MQLYFINVTFSYFLLVFFFLFPINASALNQKNSTAFFHQQYIKIFKDERLSDLKKIHQGQNLLFNINENDHPKISAIIYLELIRLSAKKNDIDAYNRWRAALSNLPIYSKSHSTLNFLLSLYEMDKNRAQGKYLIAISQGESLKEALKKITVHKNKRLIDNKIVLNKTDEAKLHNTLGISYYIATELEKSQHHFLHAMKIYKDLQLNYGQLAIYNNLSLISWSQKNYPQAIAFMEESLTVALEIKDIDGYLSGLINLGIYHAAMQQFEKSLALYNNVLTHEETSKYPKTKILALLAKAEILQETKQYLQSHSLIKQAINISTETKDNVNKLMSEIALADLLSAQNNHDKSLAIYLRILKTTQTMGDVYQEADLLLKISKLYKKKDQLLEALNYFEQHTQVNNERQSRLQKDKIISIQEKYQAQSKEAEIKLLKQENRLFNSEVDRKANQTKFILIISITALIAISLLLSRFYTRKQSHKLRQHNEKMQIKEKQLRLLSHAFSNTSDAVFITNAFFEIEAVNNAFVQHTHKTKSEVVGKKINFPTVQGQDIHITKRIIEQTRISDTWHGELFDQRSGGEIYPIELNIEAIKNTQNETIHYLGIFRDITERKRSQDQMKKLATHDDLTNLPNRTILDQLIQQSCLNAMHSKKTPTLLLLDVNGFKKINDSYGHDIGDNIIVEIAERLKKVLLSKDVISRISGAEFCILVELSDPKRTAARIAQKIIGIFEQPFLSNSTPVIINASIGITLYPDDSDNAQGLLRKAAIAMLDIKKSENHHFRFFEKNMNNEITKQLEQEQKILNAIINQQFEFYYQPLVDIKTGKITGAEALIRWIEPDGTIISPDQFIPLAEQAGFIDQIDRITINKVFSQIAVWQQKEQNFGTISINLSAKTFSQPLALLNMLQAKISQYAIAPEKIKIEITEGMLLNNIEQAIETMNGIKAIGFQLALDDFGTGFSSLNYLKKFPLDFLKIDRSFIAEIHESSVDKSIVGSIISLAHTLNLKVVGEGVEMEKHLTELQNLACEEYQGFYYSKPLQLHAFEALLNNEHS